MFNQSQRLHNEYYIQEKTFFILKMINFQNSLKPQINFKINFRIEKYIQAFFDKIANTISDYKQTKETKRKLNLENGKTESRKTENRMQRTKIQSAESKKTD